VAAARATRQQAIDIAVAAGRTDLLIAAFTGWTEPTPWQAHPYGTVDQPVVTQLARLLELPGLDPAVRCRLLEAVTAELAGEGRMPEAEGIGVREYTDTQHVEHVLFGGQGGN
jgi:hypothetical protein